jgi:hypothetical protein
MKITAVRDIIHYRDTFLRVLISNSRLLRERDDYDHL